MAPAAHLMHNALAAGKNARSRSSDGDDAVPMRQHATDGVDRIASAVLTAYARHEALEKAAQEFPVARKPAPRNARIDAVNPCAQPSVRPEQLLKEVREARLHLGLRQAGRAGRAANFSGQHRSVVRTEDRVGFASAPVDANQAHFHFKFLISLPAGQAAPRSCAAEADRRFPFRPPKGNCPGHIPAAHHRRRRRRPASRKRTGRFAERPPHSSS